MVPFQPQPAPREPVVSCPPTDLGLPAFVHESDYTNTIIGSSGGKVICGQDASLPLVQNQPTMIPVFPLVQNQPTMIPVFSLEEEST